jgi:hypothetical protein
MPSSFLFHFDSRNDRLIGKSIRAATTKRPAGETCTKPVRCDRKLSVLIEKNMRDVTTCAGDFLLIIRSHGGPVRGEQVNDARRGTGGLQFQFLAGLAQTRNRASSNK